MLGKHLLSEDTVLLNFEFMSWLINEFGPPHAPTVPSPLHRTPLLTERVWTEDDQRSVSVWAEDELAHIKNHCHMDKWNLSAQPLEDGSLPFENGIPSVFYDPEKCSEPGYFTACVINRLAELLIDSRLEPDTLSEDFYQQLKVLTICYLGQGFTFVSLAPDYLKDYVPEAQSVKAFSKRVANRAVFGTALVLACRRLNVHDMSDLYSPMLSRAAHKKLCNCFKQLEEFDTDVKTLKMMCGKGQGGTVEADQKYAQTA